MKKRIYIFLTIVLLLLLSALVYQVTLIMGYSQDISTFITIFLICIVGGYGLGQYWWQYIYIDKKRFLIKRK